MTVLVYRKRSWIKRLIRKTGVDLFVIAVATITAICVIVGAWFYYR
jgi:hypothetical protein